MKLFYKWVKLAHYIKPCILLGVTLFLVFLSGKSSWVPSRTQGLFPPVAGSRFVLLAASIVFAMWAWRLDHMGMVSVVSLLVCFCRMWLCTGHIWLQIVLEIMLLPLIFTLVFVINYSYSGVWDYFWTVVTSGVLCWITTILARYSLVWNPL
jgi:hypothetical protein